VGSRIRVGSLDELPPGKGKTLVVSGREVTVYNSEGRFVATATAAPRTGAVPETACDMPGHIFTVGPATTPAGGAEDLRSDELRFTVVVDADSVYVEEAPAPN
jgi:hypothetical protein